MCAIEATTVTGSVYACRTMNVDIGRRGEIGSGITPRAWSGRTRSSYPKRSERLARGNESKSPMWLSPMSFRFFTIDVSNRNAATGSGVSEALFLLKKDLKMTKKGVVLGHTPRCSFFAS